MSVYNKYIINRIKSLSSIFDSLDENCFECICQTRKCDSVLDELVHCLYDNDNNRWEQYIYEYNLSSQINNQCVQSIIAILELFIQYNTEINNDLNY